MTPTVTRLPSLDDPETLRALVPQLREGLYITDADGRLLDVSAGFVALVGASTANALIGRPFDELLAEPATGRTARARQITLLRADGGRRIVTDTTIAQRDGDGRTFYLGVLADGAPNAPVASHRDELTGVYDRGQLEVIARDVDRTPGNGWACLYVDVEQFGAYNATHGRDAGDGILVRMARFLMRQVRADEPVVRLANDEFVVILHGTTDGRTERIARRIQLTALRTAPAAFTLGWAMREEHESIDALIARVASRRVLVRVAEWREEQRRS